MDLEGLRRGKRIEHYETARLHKDGHRIEVSVTVSMVKNKAGAVVGASVITRDITDRKRIEINNTATTRLTISRGVRE